MRKTTFSRLALTLAVALVGVAISAPIAVAQTDDPSAAQYQPPNIPGKGTGTSSGSGSDPGSGSGSSAGASESSDDATGLSAPLGSLPFTGMDLLIVGGVALLLMGTGVALRKLSTPRDTTS